LHEKPVVVQAESQQSPDTQLPLAQPLAAAHELPFGCFSKQVLPLHQ
jgi:hypothetical protein